MFKVIIVDDESGARKVISAIIRNFTKNFEIIAEADSVESGIKTINDNEPDIVMLDINLQDGTGFDILKKLDKVDFKLIFITAYDEFAIQAIKFSAFDYILKPVDADELVETLSKIETVFNSSTDKSQIEELLNGLANKPKEKKKIILKTSESIHIVDIQDIVYCKSDNNYTEFHFLHKKMILVSNTLKYYEGVLAAKGFIRSHQSYLVNAQHIKAYEKRDGGYLLVSNNEQIAVSNSKRQLVFEAIESL